MQKSLIVLLLTVPFSCLSPEEIDVSADPEVVLMDETIKQIFSDQRDVQIKKTVYLDGKEEHEVIRFDTLVLQQDLKALKNYSFSRLIKAAAYDKTRSEEGWLFSRKDGERKGPTEVWIGKQEDKISGLSLEFVETNILYSSKREIRLLLDNNRLEAYQISGERKLFGLAPTTFSIKAGVDSF